MNAKKLITTRIIDSATETIQIKTVEMIVINLENLLVQESKQMEQLAGLQNQVQNQILR